MTDLETLSAEIDIRLKPERPEAGAEMEITIGAAAQRLANRDGLTAMLRDGNGHALATAPLERHPDDGATRAVLRVAAPRATGAHTWSVSLVDADGIAADTSLTFEVGAHAIRPSIWNLPPAITVGRKFRFTVGLACPAGCTGADWTLVLVDGDGTVLQSGTTSPEPLPGTAGIHGTDMELVAPPTAGRHIWRLRPVAPEGDGLHVPVAVDVHLNVVRPPDRMIRVRAVDAASGAPVERARVVAHPFRAVTDAQGRAEIAVPSGTYRVFVSGHQYFPFRSEADLEAAQSMEIIAELHVDRPYEEADQWA